jgi:hypothetical protein
MVAKEKKIDMTARIVGPLLASTHPGGNEGVVESAMMPSTEQSCQTRIQLKYAKL